MEPVAQFLEKIDEIENNLANAGLDARLQQDVRVALEHLKRATIQWRPFEDLHGLMLRVSDHLDSETTERKQFYDRLRTIEIDTKRTLKFFRVICFLFTAIVVFWSVIGWWILNDEISALFRAIASLLLRGDWPGFGSYRLIAYPVTRAAPGPFLSTIRDKQSNQATAKALSWCSGM